MNDDKFFSANQQWAIRLWNLVHGRDVIVASPRGLVVREQLHQRLAVDMTQPLVTHPLRKINPRFAAAEAAWIIRGSDRVNELTPYNKRMAAYSDDGETLAGAYGPRLNAQREHVLNALLRDRDTRQAVASIWTPNPAPSKDIPCTLALSFMIRNDQLHAYAFMRSSDVWLGVPYDVFSFSCYAAVIAALYNQMRPSGVLAVRLGRLHLTAASSHLYEEHYALARACLAVREYPPSSAAALAVPLNERDAAERIYANLVEMRDGRLL